MKRQKIFFVWVVIGIVGMIGVSVNQFIKIPIVQMTYPDKECVRVLTKDGKEDCSWLKKNEVRKYHVEYVMKY